MQGPVLCFSGLLIDLKSVDLYQPLEVAYYTDTGELFESRAEEIIVLTELEGYEALS